MSTKYSGTAVDQFAFKIEFIEDEIKLGIPPEGITQQGWRITPPYYPRVRLRF